MTTPGYQLVCKLTEAPIVIGEKVTTFRGESAVVTDWTAPREGSASTGRVYLKIEDYEPFGYYPSVIDAKIVKL